VLDSAAPYISPEWVPGDDDLIIHTRWSDTNFSTFEVADLAAGKAYEVAGLPLGRYLSAAVCECTGLHRTVAFLKTGGDSLTGEIVATAGEGLYLGDLTLPGGKGKVEIKNIRFVPSEISPWEKVNMRFIEKNKKILVQQANRAFIIDLDAGPSGVAGTYSHITVASGRMSQEIVVSSPHPVKVKSQKSYAPTGVAFVEGYHVYFVPGDKVKDGEAVWAKPANATAGLARLSLDGGHNVTWSPDGSRLFWFLGRWAYWSPRAPLTSTRSLLTLARGIEAEQVRVRDQARHNSFRDLVRQKPPRVPRGCRGTIDGHRPSQKRCRGVKCSG
jgi:hypothetical protein